MIQWEYTQHQGGEDELIITQRQKTGGRVQWGFEKDTLFRLKKKGPEVFYVNEDDVDQEVPFVHPKAKRAERNGGKLLIQSEEAIAGRQRERPPHRVREPQTGRVVSLRIKRYSGMSKSKDTNTTFRIPIPIPVKLNQKKVPIPVLYR